MTISLTKGNSLSLKKADGGVLSRIVLGLGWDEASGGLRGMFGGGGGSVDLDASAILYDADKRHVDTVYYGQLTSHDGSVKHSGDNLTGAGEGDDEQIVVDLTRVPANVENIVFVITSYSGHKFDRLKNVFARVVDASSGSGSEVVRYNLAESANTTANIIAKLSRDGGQWKFTAIGEFDDARTANKLVAKAAVFL